MAYGQDDALELLATAEATKQAVRARAAWEYRGYFAWALWLLIFLPPVGFTHGPAWGVVVVATSGIGTLLTAVYFSTRARQVHLARAMRTRRWLLFWAAWAPWYAACIFGANVLRSHIGYSWSLAAVASALPCLVAGYLGWRSR